MRQTPSPLRIIQVDYFAFLGFLAPIVCWGLYAVLTFLQPGDAPEAVFPGTPEQMTARAYCNLHGLWKAE